MMQCLICHKDDIPGKDSWRHTHPYYEVLMYYRLHQAKEGQQQLVVLLHEEEAADAADSV